MNRSASVMRRDYMQIRKRNQEFRIKDPNPGFKTLEDLIVFINSLTKLRRRVLNVLFFYSNYYETVYPTQDTIAQKAGCSREEACRILAYFEKCGLIITDYRHMTSKLYKVSSYFCIPGIRRVLSKMFTSLKWLSFVSLTQLMSNCPKVNSYINNNGVLDYYVTVEMAIKIKSIDPEVVRRELSEMSDTVAKKMDMKNPISQEIRDLKFLNLSKWGQISLSVFPTEAIKDTVLRFKSATNIREPFKWFYKLAHEYCEREGLPLLEGKFKALSTYFRMPMGAPMTIEVACQSPISFVPEQEQPAVKAQYAPMSPVVIPSRPVKPTYSEHNYPVKQPSSYNNSPSSQSKNIMYRPYVDHLRASRSSAEVLARMENVHKLIKDIETGVAPIKIFITPEDEMKTLRRIIGNLTIEYVEAIENEADAQNIPKPKMYLDGLPIDIPLAKKPEEVKVEEELDEDPIFEEMFTEE